MPIVHKYRNVMRVVPCALEENPPAQKTDLERGDVDVCSVLVPGPRSNKVGDDGREEAVEVEEEKEPQDATDQ